ncbi:MAG: PAS domain S-box protein [Chloroflexota bacterium]
MQPIVIEGDLAERLRHRAAAANLSVEAYLEAVTQTYSQLQATVMNQIQDGIIIVDARHPGQPVIYTNPAFETIAGRPVTSINGQPCLDIYADFDIPTDTRKALQSALTTNESSTLSLQLDRDNTLRWYRLTITPVCAPTARSQAALTHYMITHTDITQQVEAVEARRLSEDNYRIISELMSDYAFSIRIEPDGRYVMEWVTDSYERILGTPPDPVGEEARLTAYVHPDDKDRVEGEIQWMLDHNQPVTSEYRVIVDDQTFWLRIRRRPMWDEAAGRVVRFYGAAQDITAQVKAEEARSIALNRLSTLVDLTSDYALDIHVRQDSTLEVHWMTDEPLRQLTGQSIDALISAKGWIRLVHPDDQAFAQYMFEQALVTPGDLRTTFRVIDQEETVRYFQVYTRSIADDGQRVSQVIAAARDISTHVSTQLALQESELRFRAMADSAPIMIWLADTEGAVSFVNATLYQFKGRELAQELGAGWLEGVHPDETAQVSDRFYQFIAQQEAYQLEYRLRRHDGVYRWVLEHGAPRFAPDGSFTGFIGTCIDITDLRETNIALEQRVAERTSALKKEIEERRRIQRDLEISEARYRAISDLVSDYAYEYDIDDDGQMVLRWMTGAFESITGYTQQEYMESKAIQSEIIHPDDLPLVRQQYAILRAGAQQIEFEFRQTTKSGRISYVRNIARSVYDPAAGRVTRIIGTSTDVTGQKLITQALQHERDLLENVIRMTPAAIFLIAYTGNIIFASDHAEKIFGISPVELQTYRHDDSRFGITNLAGRPITPETLPFTRVMASGQPLTDAQHMITRADGRRVLLSVNGTPVFDRHGQIQEIILTLEDITMRQRWEDHMQMALQRERELNKIMTRLVATVSHEFRTPLTIINTSAHIMRAKDATISSEERFERIDRIEEQVQRLASMVDDILMLNQAEITQHALTLTPLDPATFLQRLANQVQVSNGNHVSVRVTCPVQQTWPLDEMLISQIFTHLLSNAIKYSPAGSAVEVMCTINDDQLVIRVRDEGIGIPADEQADLFEPFHRASNARTIPGTGVGLVVVKQAVANHQGQISFESEENGGTTFTVVIPRLDM